jgi:hypothetical protein
VRWREVEGGEVRKEKAQGKDQIRSQIRFEVVSPVVIGVRVSQGSNILRTRSSQVCVVTIPPPSLPVSEGPSAALRRCRDQKLCLIVFRLVRVRVRGVCMRCSTSSSSDCFRLGKVRVRLGVRVSA